MTTEKNVKPEKKDEKGKEGKDEKGSLGKAFMKYAPLAMKSAVVTLATTAVFAAGCMSDDKKTSNDTNTAEATEVVDESDAEGDVPEEVLDAEDTMNDVDDRDGPVRLDSIEEDVRRDPSVDGVEDVSEDTESDASVDIGSDAGEEIVPGTCGPVAAVSTVVIGPGETATVGNVTVEYMGMSGSDGRYQVSCGTLVDTITVPERSTDVVDLGVGYVVELHVNTVRSYGSNLTITVRASS